MLHIMILDFLPVEFQILPDLTFYRHGKNSNLVEVEFCQIGLSTSLIKIFNFLNSKF